METKVNTLLEEEPCSNDEDAAIPHNAFLELLEASFTSSTLIENVLMMGMMLYTAAKSSISQWIFLAATTLPWILSPEKKGTTYKAP